MAAMRTAARMAARATVVPAAVGAVYALAASGSLTVDVGLGRRVRRLGPTTISIAAPRDLVFDVIAAPYLGRASSDVAAKVQVLERGSDLVVAAHRTPLAGGLTAVTVESVHLERPHRVGFRLLRGPVPHVAEEFRLDETDAGTELTYDGELGTDLWALGAWWGGLVARKWEATVDSSLADVRDRAEARAAAHARRAQAGPGT